MAATPPARGGNTSLTLRRAAGALGAALVLVTGAHAQSPAGEGDSAQPAPASPNAVVNTPGPADPPAAPARPPEPGTTPDSPASTKQEAPRKRSTRTAMPPASAAETGAPSQTAPKPAAPRLPPKPAVASRTSPASAAASAPAAEPLKTVAASASAALATVALDAGPGVTTLAAPTDTTTGLPATPAAEPGFLSDHGHWLWLLAALPFAAWLWAWVAHRMAYDEAGLPRGPRLRL